MSNYRDSEMHKSIMAEKAKQDAGRKKKVEKAPAKGSDSAFVKKPQKDPIAEAIKEKKKNKKIGTNLVGSAVNWLRG